MTELEKHTIKTGFYSDYAAKLFNCIMLETRKLPRNAAVNYNIYGLFKIASDVVPLYSQTYEFQHAPNGEVQLVDIEIAPGRFYHWQFSTYDNKKHKEIIALQLKNLVAIEVGDLWRRHEFDTSVVINGESFPVAELYFVFDVLWNHIKSINCFKARHPEVAAKILGTPKDPVATEFLQMVREKRKKLFIDYSKATEDLRLDEVRTYTGSKANREFGEKVKALYAEFKATCEKRAEELKEQLDKDLAEIDEYLNAVSNNIAA